jgi:hypothetical protein
LRKDPGHLESRQRLIVLAPAVLDGYLIQSANDARREAFIDAADAIIAADHLLANMRSLGITVAVPAGYASLRRKRFEHAIEQSMRAAQRATIDGHWALAASTYEKIARFEPAPRQRAEYDNGHFRSALDYVAQGLDVPVATRHVELPRLHDQIVYDGTQRVLFLPVSSPPHGTPARPRFTRDLDDALQREHWRNLPVLVEAINSSSFNRHLRRKMRWPGDARVRPNRRQALRAGRLLDADWVVLISLEDFSQVEKITSRKQRSTTLRNGKKATYEERKGRLTSTATARYELVSVTGDRPGRHARVKASKSKRFHDAVYKGDARQLSLSKKQRSLFRAARSTSAQQTFDHELAQALAARIAAPVLRYLDSD